MDDSAVNTNSAPQDYVPKRRNSLPETPQAINDIISEVPPPLDLSVLYGKQKDEKPPEDTSPYFLIICFI